jgi:hypothetical protein
LYWDSCVLAFAHWYQVWEKRITGTFRLMRGREVCLVNLKIYSRFQWTIWIQSFNPFFCEYNSWNSHK